MRLRFAFQATFVDSLLVANFSLNLPRNLERARRRPLLASWNCHSRHNDTEFEDALFKRNALGCADIGIHSMRHAKTRPTSQLFDLTLVAL
jgi:hypothetical protein